MRSMMWLLGRVMVVTVMDTATSTGSAFVGAMAMRVVVMASGHLPGCQQHVGPVGDLHPQDGVPREVLLARTAPRPLTRNDRAALEDLATPHAPRLGALDGAREALGLHGAAPTKCLRDLEVSRRVGEPQVRVVLAARHLCVQPDLKVEWRKRQSHLPVHLFPCSSLTRDLVNRTGNTLRFACDISPA